MSGVLSGLLKTTGPTQPPRPLKLRGACVAWCSEGASAAVLVAAFRGLAGLCTGSELLAHVPGDHSCDDVGTRA
eukprot:2644195-Alexandrium_andersonii.AAC.1